MLLSLRLTIQSAIVDFLKDMDFPVVVYDASGDPNIIDPSEPSSSIRPLTPIICNETGSIFEEDPLYKRGRILQRSSWTFQIKMRFDREVLLEVFEESWMRSPLVIPATENHKQITLLLQSSDPTHPVQQSGANGTAVTYTFEAQVARG